MSSSVRWVKLPEYCVAMLWSESKFCELGIKTLDPADWAYRGTYDNSNDSEDSTVAHGFNYHQGPEWVWVFGMFLRAYLGHHSTKPNLTKDQAAKLVSKVQGWMLPHKLHIANDSFAGLPELTNKDGAHCHGSCPTQAWSSGVMVEVIADLKKFVDRK